MENRKKIIIGISVVALFLVVGIGITYSLWSKTYSQSGENQVVSDCFHIQFQETENIQLEDAFPILDSEGKRLTPYQFLIQNMCNVSVEYQVNYETLNTTTMKDEYVKFMFQENEPKLLTEYTSTEVTLKNGKNAYLLEKGYLQANETKEYSVRIWMDENVTQNDEGAMNSIHESKITVISSYLIKYIEPILNGTDPVLKEGLIPVTIDNDGTVKKANEREEWYKYENKKWANAVILNNENISYENNEVIPEDNIESYFVWIPRYKYQIFNEGNYEGQNQELLVDNQLPSKAQEIKIEFENKNTSQSNGSTVGSWLTHPAFTSFDVNGLWIGKFETGYKGSTSMETAQSNTNNPDKVQIKPNVNSWRSIQVANAYLTSYDYKRNLDSHMMKNTEWGAVAYLQHSKYGSMTSVRINNNENFITGYAAVKEPTCGYTETKEECNRYGNEASVTQAYNTTTGVLASTTGNISGIYDMSGGAWEYVMGVMVDKNGNPMSGRNSLYNSGFNGSFGCPTCDGDTSGLTELTTGVLFPTDTRYYDTYAYAENAETYNRRILGDATGEMGPFATYGTQQRQIGSWYADEVWFVLYAAPWFGRGWHYLLGSGAGVFAFEGHLGHADSNESFRIVLTGV